MEVVILAQGTQSRMGPACGFKQLLELPACNVPIMARTIIQVRRLLGSDSPPTIVTWPAIASQLFPWNGSVLFTTLPDPGNSSLKGISRFLDACPDDQFVVLLGDVVYSWACLEACIKAASGWGFVGTPDLSASGGELWGVGWSEAFHDHMVRGLHEALLQHPPFGEYQPGQLRRWISGLAGAEGDVWRRAGISDHTSLLREWSRYTDIADYTHDIDIPAHLALLPWLSEAAAEDDRKHGLDWGAT